MKLAALLFSLLAMSATAQAQELANCTNPAGFAYFAQKGLVDKKHAGWGEDKITGGIVTLKRLGDKDYDVLFVDSGKSIRSAKQEGGLVRLLRAGESDMTFLVFYPGQTIELYTFMRESDGSHTMQMLSSKGGDLAKIHKSGLMVGTCDRVQFVKE
jgi:hypothetical protein